MKDFFFGTRPIGEDYPCFIIAEAGVNHNGDLDLAMRLIDAAREAGADAVKFQTFQTALLVAKGTAMSTYQARNTGEAGGQTDLLKGLELSETAFSKLFAYGRKKGLPVFSTPDEEASARLLARLNPQVFKIGSGELTNFPFLRFLGGLGKPLILSTGMGTLAETALAIEALTAGGAKQIALLHCVSAYPAPFSTLNLRAIQTMRSAFDLPVGFSDHTLGVEVAIGAVALGACIIEKHLTLSKSLPGSDHSCSLDPTEFAAMVNQIRNLEQALGHGVKEPAAIELETRKVVRKVLVASRDLSPGTLLLEADLVAKRCGCLDWIAPGDLEKVIGLPVQCYVTADEPVTWDFFRPMKAGKTRKHSEPAPVVPFSRIRRRKT